MPQQITRQLTIIIIALVFIAAQCRAGEQTTPTPTTIPPTPTVVLVPPLQPGDGTDLIDHLLEDGVIRVGIRVWPGADFAPPAFRGFSNAETGGALNGFEIDIAHQIADGLGLELELVEAYPPVLATGRWQGEWDIAIAALVPFDQSPDTMRYSIPYGYIPMGILVPENSDIQNWEQLAGKRVGVLEHSAYQRLLSANEAGLTVGGQALLNNPPSNVQPVQVSNLITSIKQLGTSPTEQTPPEEKADALIGPTPIFQEAIESGLPVRIIAHKDEIQPLAVAVVPQDNLRIERLTAEINKVLERLHRNGTLAEIYLRWYDQDFSQLPANPPIPGQ